MAGADRVCLAGPFERLEPECPDRLEHRDAELPEDLQARDQALVDEVRHAVERIDAEIAVLVGDQRDDLERDRTDEDREPAEQALLRLGEEVVAPGDRAAQRPLPLGAIAWAGRRRQASELASS